jgi:hypothetical protein
VSATIDFITDVPIGSPGSLTALMDRLTALQALLPGLPALADLPGDVTLRTYRWRPDTPDPPCLWNTLLPSTSQQMDLIRRRDTFVISSRIGQGPSDSDQLMSAVEMYADAYRALVDANFWSGSGQPPAIQGAITWAMRTSLNSFMDSFGSSTVSGIEFIQTFISDRQVQ